MQQPIVGPGLCECGCGLVAPVADRTFSARGVVKGQSFRFARGHKSSSGPVAFWERVPRHLPPDECWPWQGSVDAKGYGKFSDYGAHRLAYEAAHGPIPTGLHALHSCDNPPCVNPAHIFIGTNADNVADKVMKGRASSRLRKLTMPQADEIRALWAEGSSTQGALAERFGVPRPTVNRIVNGLSYRS